MSPTAPSLAYLTAGRIKIASCGETPRIIESKFAQSIRDKALQHQQRHAWKGGDAEGGVFAGPSVWGKAGGGDGAIPISITSLCRGNAKGQVLYSMESNNMCSMLALEEFGADERRLWNDHKTTATRLNVNDGGDVVASIEHQYGTANIGVKLTGEGSGFSEVTEGDSLDTAPRWVVGKSKEIVFQSAGVGRNQHGHVAALAPFAINHLDLQTLHLETLVEDPDYDFLIPSMLEDGTLYYIRRPYLAALKPSFFAVVKDTLLFPFRLLYSLFQFLNFFAMLFTGKRLNRAGHVPQKEVDIKQMLIWGRMVQTQKNRPHQDEAPDLVPKSWELIRKDSAGKEQVLARGVLDYDVSPAGQVVYTSGSAIYSIDADGRSQKLHSDKMISQVALV